MFSHERPLYSRERWHEEVVGPDGSVSSAPYFEFVGLIQDALDVLERNGMYMGAASLDLQVILTEFMVERCNYIDRKEYGNE